MSDAALYQRGDVKLAVGQIWIPAHGRRTIAREINKLADNLGLPSVFWAPFWPNCGHTDTSVMTARGFHAWIREHRATLKEAT